MSRARSIIGYSIIATLVTQVINITVWGVWLGFFTLTPFEQAMATESRLEQLQEKYDLANPHNNRGDDKKLQSVLDKYKNQGNNDPTLENRVIEKYFVNGQPNSKEIDLSKYNIGNKQESQELIENSIAEARSIAASAGMPTLNENNAVEMNYHRQGVKLSKDEDGNYVTEKYEEGYEDHTMGVDEYASSEINHDDARFEAPQFYNDEQGFIESGKKQITHLKTAKSSDGTAYQTIMAIQNDNPPPEINPRDSIFNHGFNEVSDAITGSGNWLSACTDTKVEFEKEFTSTQTINQLCMEPASDNKFYCEVERIYNIEMAVRSVAGNVSVDACGDGCIDVKFNPGEKGADFYNGGACTIFEEAAVIELNPNLQVDSVRMIESNFDDHGIIKVNGVPAWSVIDGVYGATGTWSGPCERRTNWESTTHQGKLEQVLKEQFVDMNGVLGLKMQTRVGDLGGGYFHFRIQLSDPDGEPWGISYKQYPEGCYDAVDDVLKEKNGLFGLEPDGKTEPTPYPYSFCRFDSYTNIDVGDGNLPETLLANVPPWYEGDTGNKTWRVNLDGFRCDPTGGKDYCVLTKRATDEEKAQGIEDEYECYSWDDIKAQQNQCAVYEEDEMCTEVARDCAEGWEWDRPDGQADICFAHTVEYQCKEEVTHTVTTSRTENSCAATLPCIGGECETANQESNDDFANAAAMASVVQHMEDGMTCDDPADPTTCTIFEGEGKFCSWEPIGLGNDCCEAPDGVDIYEYAKAAYGMLQADAYVAGLESTNVAVGTYQSFRQPIADAATSTGEAVSQAWGAVSSTFTDAATSAAGSTGGTVTDAAGAVMDVFTEKGQEALQQTAMNYLNENLPQELAEALFKETTTNGVTNAALSEGASQMVTMIGYAYTAYMVYQYIKLAMQLLTACHEYEMDMGIRIATKQCIPVEDKYCAKDGLGVCYLRRQDYCCYDSILARIIMEQVSPMLGHDLTQYSGEIVDDSQLRSCPGLTPDQLSNLDWDQIDLSEWISVMIESGITDFDQDINKLTGSGRMINNENRENAAERTQNRANEASLADRAIETRKIIDANEVDCSYVPRPLSCYFNDN